jgi:quercetin dioxygenase-like cupin family protein
MRKFLFIFFTLYSSLLTNGYGHTPNPVIVHSEVKSFNMNGNTIQGLATKAHGAKEFEVWRSTMGVGKSTPLHKHSSEEIFVVLAGKVEITIGNKTSRAVAPVTIIAPADTYHQVKNIGSSVTEQIVILGIDSEVWNNEGKKLSLPWRK